MQKSANFLIQIIILGLVLKTVVLQQYDCKPRQMRLIFGDDYTQYSQPQQLNNTATIIYQTTDECRDSQVKVDIESNETIYHAEDGYRQIVHSKWNGEQFCHSGKICQNLFYDQYVHIYRLPIQIGVKFSYQVFGSIDQFSKVFKSILPKINKEENEIQRVLFFGDQDESLSGKINFKAISKLKANSEKKPEDKVDSLIFLGDYAYEFYEKNGQKGDSYLDQVEEYIAEWPTAFSPGNHEDQYNFKFFNEKFQLPSFSETKNNYYSFNQGLVHFIGVNLHYFSSWANDQEKEIMLNWLEQDLIKANENRKQTPWIIAFGHKSIYCVQSQDCLNFPKTYIQIDDLFYNYSVDIYLGAHVHLQEYIKPMYRESIQKYDGDEKNVKNPNGMLTFIQGNGGKFGEFLNNLNIKFLEKKNPSSFEVKYFVGYGILEVHNENKICVKHFNSVLNIQSSEHCIESNHKFDRDLQNTEVIQSIEQKAFDIQNIFIIAFSVIVSSSIAYYLLKFKDQQCLQE